MRRTPPSRLVASPREETTASILFPTLAKAGISAVTITAATLFTFAVLGSTTIPIFSSILESD
ncbi:MAG: hypothetical protein A4E57_03520 [Syntrophorhabdaceae bacterium PtaU1.Bin034]|nr:MAG: hypothetical protein A4E57_03520 [Syntrophorhabdaceae bacterium PtaU1.Bin034]